MRRRRFQPIALGCLSLLAVTGLGGCGKEESGTRPNVLLIVVDTLRSDHLQPYGYKGHPTSPILQALVEEDGAQVYRGMLGSSSWTKPGVATLFTGLDGDGHGVMRLAGKGARLKDPNTLAAEFGKGGYATGCVMSNFLLKRKMPEVMQSDLHAGFDFYDDSVVPADPHRGVSAPAVTESGINWLQQQGEDPWLMVLHYFDPHASFEDHPEVDWLDPEYRGWVIGGASTDLLRQKEKNLSPADRRALVSFYDEEILAVDREIGRVVAHLKATGQWEDTVLIFTADHGEELGERGHIGHTQTLRSELVDLPCIVRVPERWQDDWVLEAAVGGGYAMRQLYPAMLHVAGLELPAGRTLEAPSILKTQVDFVPVRKEHVEKYVQKRGVRKDGLYYVRDMRSGTELLFDLTKDPGTNHPLPEEHAGWEPMRKAFEQVTWWEAP